MPHSPPTILFLFRSMADFDHMVPVAYKLSETNSGLKIIFCCTNITFAFHQTQLERFLTEELRVKCVYLHELCLPTLYHRWFSKYLVYQEVISGGILSRVLNRFCRKRLKEILYDARYSHYFLNSQHIRSIVIDVLSPRPWPHQKWFYGAILPFAPEHQVSVYWMNHAPPITNNKLHYDTSNRTKKVYYEWISTFLICSEWLKSYYVFGRGVKAEDISVVGNPRYCHEWLKKWGDYCRISNDEMNVCHRPQTPDRPQGTRLRVIIIESDQGSIILDKYLELIKAIKGLEEIELKVLPHPRREVDYLLAKYHPELIVDKHQPSTNMVQWCDVAVVGDSTLAWECLERNKYLIHIDYILNRTFAHLLSNDMRGVGLYGSDTKEVLTQLQDIKKGKGSRPMDNPTYLHLRKNIIYGGLEKDSVLQRHADEINK